MVKKAVISCSVVLIDSSITHLQTNGMQLKNFVTLDKTKITKEIFSLMTLASNGLHDFHNVSFLCISSPHPIYWGKQ
jgi:hypothetical protein